MEEEIYGRLMQDSAIFHTVNCSVATLEGVFGKWLIRRSLWPPSFILEYMLFSVGDTEIIEFM